MIDDIDFNGLVNYINESLENAKAVDFNKLASFGVTLPLDDEVIRVLEDLGIVRRDGYKKFTWLASSKREYRNNQGQTHEERADADPWNYPGHINDDGSYEY